MNGTGRNCEFPVKDRYPCLGKVMVKTVPRSRLWKLMFPPCASSNSLARPIRDRSRLVPPPAL